MLTERQERFCLAYIELGDASKAYREAYSTEKMKPTTVNRNAKALMDNHKIAARIEALRAPIREKTQMTFERHLGTLRELRDAAAAKGNFAAAISAEIARGKACGHYIEKQEVVATIAAEVEVIQIPDNDRD